MQINVIHGGEMYHHSSAITPNSLYEISLNIYTYNYIWLYVYTYNICEYSVQYKVLILIGFQQ